MRLTATMRGMRSNRGSPAACSSPMMERSCSERDPDQTPPVLRWNRMAREILEELHFAVLRSVLRSCGFSFPDLFAPEMLVAAVAVVASAPAAAA
jgi:hypothetical protein